MSEQQLMIRNYPNIAPDMMGAAVREAIEFIDFLEGAVNRSAFDVSVCVTCGMPCVVLPDGLPTMCHECVATHEE